MEEQVPDLVRFIPPPLLPVVLARQPLPDSLVNPDYTLYLAASHPNGFNVHRLALQVDGVAVYTPDVGFSYPDWTGQLTVASNFVSIRATPRRQASPGAQIQVRCTFVSAGTPSETLVDTFSFRARKPRTHINVEELSSSQQRMLRQFPFSALDQLRQLVGTALSPDPRLVALAVPYRLARSSVSPLGASLSNVQADQAFEPGELYTLDRADTQLLRLLGVWERALGELKSLGLGEQSALMLRRAMESGWPQNRVGAVCAVTLLAAAFLDAQGI